MNASAPWKGHSVYRDLGHEWYYVCLYLELVVRPQHPGGVVVHDLEVLARHLHPPHTGRVTIESSTSSAIVVRSRAGFSRTFHLHEPPAYRPNLQICRLSSYPADQEHSMWMYPYTCYDVLTTPMIWCLVVCCLGLTMDTRSPTSAFISVDLPTFGLPRIVTKPAHAIIHSI